MTPINTLKNWFRNGLKPTQEQFWAWMDSYRHKSEKISQSDVQDLDQTLSNKSDSDHTHSDMLKLENLDDYYKKVEDPGDGKNYLLKIDGTAVDASDFGKVEKVMGVAPDESKNVDISNEAMDWKNASQRFSGIGDKSLDVTFNRMAVLDPNGNLGSSDGRNMLRVMPSVLTAAERNAWKTEMNGGWTTNTMSVALINPVVVRDIDAIQYITLIGANLNFNPTSFKVEIVDMTGSTVIATIPNSQVQLQSNGLSLLFYYNFQSIPLGDYKIRLWNGVATYVTQVKFTVVDNVTNIDLSAITWESKVYGDKINPSIVTSGRVVSMTANIKNADGSEFDESSLQGQAISAVLSSAIATMQDNFVIEFAFFNSGLVQERMYAGISLENAVSLAPSISWGGYLYYAAFPRTLHLSNSQEIASQSTSANSRCIIYKNSNNITTVISNSGGVNIALSTVTVDNTPIKLKLLREHFFTGEVNITSNMQIITAYKF